METSAVNMIDVVLRFGIIEGRDKRALEPYIDSRVFIQRKSYDEYTVNSENFKLSIDIVDLMIIAENFKVQVNEESIIISEKE